MCPCTEMNSPNQYLLKNMTPGPNKFLSQKLTLRTLQLQTSTLNKFKENKRK